MDNSLGGKIDNRELAGGVDVVGGGVDTNDSWNVQIRLQTRNQKEIDKMIKRAEIRLMLSQEIK